MIPLHSMLLQNFIMDNRPLVIGAGAILLLAFAYGFVKGFRKVSWDGLAWAFASALFIGIGILVPMEGSNSAGSFAIAVTVAVACVVATLGIFGVLSYFLRPKVRWIKDDINADTSLAEYGLEFEPEYLDYDGEHESNPYGMRIYKTGYGEPTFVNRFFGAIATMVYAAMVVGVLLGIGVFVVELSPLNETTAGQLLDMKAVAMAMPYVKTYLFDVLSIGLVLLMAKQGFAKGFVESVRSLGLSLAAFAVAIGSFYLPFSSWGKEGFLQVFVERCTAVFSSLGALSGILGGLLAGVCILVVASILLYLVNVLLKSLCDVIASIQITRGLDGCLSAVLYTLVGVLFCVGVWFVLALVDIMGILPIEEFLKEGAYFSVNIFQFVKSLLESWFATL